MKVPSPRVKVITWSRLMRIKRRFEVAIIDGREDPEHAEELPIARFHAHEEALSFADALRRFLGEWDRTQREDKRPACTVYGAYCSEHRFTHGAEAEELRAGIERLMATNAERTRDRGFAVNVVDLQGLLDKVDARDSLAFREATEREPARK